MTRRPVKRMKLQSADKVMTALADTNRRVMLQKLIDRPRSVNEIAAGLPISRPAVSQHLKILAAAELVVQTKDGNRRIYGPNPKAIGELRAYIDALWQASLASFAESLAKRNKD